MKHALFVAVLSLGLMATGLASAQGWGTPKPGMLDYAQRLSISALGGYEFSYASESADPTPDPGKEFTTGLRAQYLLAPSLTLEAASVYMVDTKLVHTSVRILWPFYGPQKPQAMAPVTQ